MKEFAKRQSGTRTSIPRVFFFPMSYERARNSGAFYGSRRKRLEPKGEFKMKPTIQTSMRWIQQHLRYLAYMEKHGKDGLPPPGSQLSQIQDGPETTVTEAEQSGLTDSGKIAGPR
ncbi:MAG: hypothetical protein ACLQHK_10990 [Gallionellaceae bacterium]